MDNKIPTVMIKHDAAPNGYARINEEDFDENLHELYELQNEGSQKVSDEDQDEEEEEEGPDGEEEEKKPKRVRSRRRK